MLRALYRADENNVRRLVKLNPNLINTRAPGGKIALHYVISCANDQLFWDTSPISMGWLDRKELSLVEERLKQRWQRVANIQDILKHINMDNTDRAQAFVAACQSGQHELIVALIAQGWDVNLEIEWDPRTPLRAFVNSRAAKIKTLRLLLAEGAELGHSKRSIDFDRREFESLEYIRQILSTQPLPNAWNEETLLSKICDFSFNCGPE